MWMMCGWLLPLKPSSDKSLPLWVRCHVYTHGTPQTILMLHQIQSLKITLSNQGLSKTCEGLGLIIWSHHHQQAFTWIAPFIQRSQNT